MNQSISEEKVSVTGLFKVIYQSKLTVALFIAGFIVLGLIIYFMSPKEYGYKTVLLPESSGSSMGLGALASLTGINLGRADSKERTLNPAVYESIMRSSPFLDRIVGKEYFFPSLDKKISLSDYLNKYSEKTFIEKVANIFTISSTPTSKPSNAAVIETKEIAVKKDSISKIFANSIITVSSKSAIKKLDERLIYASDMQNGLITLSFDLQDPVAGAQVLQTIVSEFISITMNYEGQKQDISLEQLDVQIKAKKQEYDAALRRAAAFKDRNRNVIQSSAQVEGQRLQNEVSFAQSVYNSLLQQRESLTIQSNDVKAPISVIEPAQVATSPYRPKLVLTLIVSIFLGLLFGSIFALSRKSIISIVE